MKRLENSIGDIKENGIGSAKENSIGIENSNISVKINHLSVVYYSMIQAGISVVDSIVITNHSSSLCSNLKMKFESEFDFVEDMEVQIEDLESGAFVELSPKFSFHARKIFELSERVRDTWKFCFYQNDELFYEVKKEMMILPVNQYTGVSVVPETIASFVMPNIPEIALILSKASQILKNKTGSPSFSAYLSEDKNRVMEQLAAIYAAIYDLGIVYSILSASFEMIGQRVRTPQEVYNFKQANCLEMSVLFASVCEAVGLNPFLVMVEGHAFVGCWLKDEIFDTTLETNIEELNKRLADGINDVVVLESTYMNQAMDKSFEQAIRAGLGHLEKEEQFIFAIDIRRCHYMGITPLPVRLVENGECKIVDYGYASDLEEKAIVKCDIEEYFLDTSQKEKMTKSAVWMRNLLDLSKRNSLISFRPNMKNLQLFTTDIFSLEDALSKGDSFDLIEVTGNIKVSRKANRIIEVENQKEVVFEISKADFKAKKIRTFMEQEDMLFVLKSIYRETQVSIEENGANSLFLALGFLKWSDPKEVLDQDGTPFFRYAPLVLIPVELKRKNMNQYKVQLRDEDAQINITLLEFLRQRFELSITGLNPLPQDESGVDIKLVLNSIRKAIMNNKGWDVVESAVLGNFSFSQFVMWNDLKERFDRLTENEVVNALVEGLYIPSEQIELGTENLDDKYRVNDVVIPSDIDSSQLSAVIEATKGASFVLHGPPGTGKSQTITNMIANALYHGKSVLFVAEKMAALNVVYERLSKIGLQDFCLELHSNKTSRRTVLEKFENCLNISTELNQEEFIRKSERISKIKEMLNLQVNELHKITSQGYSVYEWISMLDMQTPQTSKDTFVFSDEELLSINRNVWDDLLQTIRLISKALDDLKVRFFNHPLKDLEIYDYSHSEKENFIQSLKTILESVDVIKGIFSVEDGQISDVNRTSADKQIQIDNQIHIDKQLFAGSQLQEDNHENKVPSAETLNAEATSVGDQSAKVQDNRCAMNFEHLNIFCKIHSVIKEQNLQIELEEAAFYKLTDADVKNVLERVLEKFKEFERLKEQVQSNFAKDIDDVDIVQIKADFLKAQSSFFMKGSKTKKALLFFNALAKNGHSIHAENALSQFDLVASYLDEKHHLQEEIANLEKILGISLEHYDKQDVVTDLYELSKTVDFCLQTYHVKQDDIFRIYEKRKNLKEDGDVLVETMDRLQQSLDFVKDFAGYDWSEILLSEDFTAMLSQKVMIWLENMDELKEVFMLCKSLQQLDQNHFSKFKTMLLKRLKNEDLEPQGLEMLYLRSLIESLIHYHIEHNDTLRNFASLTTQEMIREYNQLVNDLEIMGKQQIKEAIIQNYPNHKSLSKEEMLEYANLTKAIRSKGRGISIRSLFKENGRIIKTLTPCMLMSPLSVAQYIDLDFPKFDLVIFDEASQIRTGIAIGAMSRAKNCVIVGDPNQMPPTSFFSSQRTDEENLQMEDLESLLEDCLAINLPEKHLTCHYRSESESLIAFSNSMYYKNRMLTFPSPTDINFGVSFQKIEGLYDRGGTRTNEVEAKAIVQEIIRRLKDEKLCNSTIGVVTFNATQQNLIDDLLQYELAQDKNLEKIAGAMQEPIFIKNLENVQGDERDVILFSITFGRDKNGKFYQNFGPLSQKGGWRRLNVAVTRARQEMMVFSSVTYDEFNIGPATSEGVIGLKKFLEFAQKGISCLEFKNAWYQSEYNQMSKSIQHYLKSEGFESEFNFGASNLSLEIVVKNPKDPNHYIGAVLIDSKRYAKMSTMRDRNRLLPQVLGRKGWNVYRIWTLSYFENSEKVLSDLKKHLDEWVLQYEKGEAS